MSSRFRLYAIVARDFPVAAVAAGHFSALERIPYRDLAAIAERVTNHGARVTTDDVVRHQTIVEAVHLQAPALPVQFGAVFRDVPSIESALEQHHERLVADLDRVGDKVELSLTALWAESLPSQQRAAWAMPLPRGATPGARYLHGRAADVRRDEARAARAQAVAAALDADLGFRALERKQSHPGSPGIAVRATYLLEPANVGDFRAAFEAIRPTRPELRLLLTGPWPPYSFVTNPERGSTPG
jgi:hypothetical protein